MLREMGLCLQGADRREEAEELFQQWRETGWSSLRCQRQSGLRVRKARTLTEAGKVPVYRETKKYKLPASPSET